MFSLKRSNYRVIEEGEEAEQQQPSGIGSVIGGGSRLHTSAADHHPLHEPEEEEDDDDHDQEAAMLESAPPSHIAVSFKGGDKDPEQLQTSTDSSTQWDHIKDVDQFFAYIYEYYQHKGFTCILMRYTFSLLRFAFVVLFSTFLLQCVDYDVLFYNRNTTFDGHPLPGKRRLQDAFIPQCHARLNPLVVLTLLLASLFWLVHLFRICYRLVQFYEIKQFFGTQLQISDQEMQNLSWAQIVQKLCLVQQRLHLIVNKEAITPLDIYQRILRHKNYFVALVYQDILPHYLSDGLRFNLEWFLFWGPWSPWKSPYALKDEYKEAAMLTANARNMQRTLAYLALINLILLPFVFVYQLLFSFFSYSEHFQRDPNVFGMRKYSNYGREKLRHFNEMDHELEARLNRSYEFAARYTDQFISPIAKIMARNTAFVAASFFVVLCALTAFDEDTLKIEHVTTMMTVSGAIVLICRVFIPNENLVFCQQFLMRQIVANIHYAPKSWLRNAHCTEVHREFTQLFRLKAEILVEELLSPVLTPVILYFSLCKRVPEIVQFLHEHTVHVEGLGDVCSLAQMDITRDGDARLVSLNQSMVVANNSQSGAGKDSAIASHKRQPNSYGKVELSLLNFATQNPSWIPSKAGTEFIQNVKDLVAIEVGNAANFRTDERNNRADDDQQQNSSSMDAKTLAFVQAQQMMSLRQMEQSLQGGMRPAVDESLFQFDQRNMATSSMAEQSRGDNIPSMASTRDVPPYGHSLEVHRGSPPNPSGFSQQSGNSNNTSTSSSVLNSAHQLPPQMFTNSRLIASSFITPSPLAAVVQPRAVQESNLRATEMSLHALAVNHMLFLNNSNSVFDQQYGSSRSRHNLLNRTAQGGGYGSILLGSIRRGGAAQMDSLSESNIWGVPAETSLMSPAVITRRVAADDEQAPLPLMEGQGRLLR